MASTLSTLGTCSTNPTKGVITSGPDATEDYLRCMAYRQPVHLQIRQEVELVSGKTMALRDVVGKVLQVGLEDGSGYSLIVLLLTDGGEYISLYVRCRRMAVVEWDGDPNHPA